MNKMIYAAIFGIIFSVCLFFLVRTILSTHDKEVIAEAPMDDEILKFEISKAGKYTIWNKRNAFFSFRKRNNFKVFIYTLTNIKTGEVIHLNTQTDAQNTNMAQDGNSQDYRWMTLYWFHAEPGSYQLKTEKINANLGAFNAFNKLGFLNPFKEINPKNYSTVITDYSESNDLKNVLTIIFWVILTAASFLATAYFATQKQ